MNKFFRIFAIFLFLCSCENKNTSPLVIETDNGNSTYNVEVASTVEELQTGLMNRESLPADGGMLFDLSVVNGQNTAMWMKNTKIALDMLFITPEGLIFWIKENAQPYSEDLIISPFPAAAVLELNAGEVAKKGIRIGNVVKHSVFPMKNIKISSPVVEDTPDTPVVDATVSPDNTQSTEETSSTEEASAVSTAENIISDENTVAATAEEASEVKNPDEAKNTSVSETAPEAEKNKSDSETDSSKTIETK